MSESKTSCPHCSQSISLDSAWSGQVLNCPSCQNPFTVPQLVPDALVGAPPSPTEGGLRLNRPSTPPAIPASSPAQRSATSVSAPTRISGLAIASVILSLLGCLFISAIA